MGKKQRERKERKLQVQRRGVAPPTRFTSDKTPEARATSDTTLRRVGVRRLTDPDPGAKVARMLRAAGAACIGMGLLLAGCASHSAPAVVAPVTPASDVV